MKFKGYCKTGGADLAKSVDYAQIKNTQSASDADAAEGSLPQHEADLKCHHADRAAAEHDMKQATAIREKASAEFAHSKRDNEQHMAL